MNAGPTVVRGVLDPRLAEEFPGLAVCSVAVDGTPGPSTGGGRRRLALLADRITGAQALELRRQEVPHAYRVFFRHVGIDPDVTRTPVEAAILGRLVDGGFPHRDRIADGCLAAVVETGVPVWAADDALLEGPLLLRPSVGGERLGESVARRPADEVAPGRLLVTDDRGVVAPLFEDVVADRAPRQTTRRVRLLTVQVPGVPDVHVREALWTAAAAVADA